MLSCSTHNQALKVLLADGRLINANANENANLHRVLKGGGSNYSM